MNNPKMELIERERIAYITGDVSTAMFFAAILDHVIELEEEVNRQALELETIARGEG